MAKDATDRDLIALLQANARDSTANLAHTRAVTLKLAPLAAPGTLRLKKSDMKPDAWALPVTRCRWAPEATDCARPSTCTPPGATCDHAMPRPW